MKHRPPRRGQGLVARFFVLLVPLLAVLLGGSLTLPTRAAAVVTTPTVAPAPTMRPQPTYQAITRQRSPIGDTFSQFYADHQGALWLGDAITPEILTAGGIEQIFQGGFLHVDQGANQTITVLPLVPTLVQVGAQLPLADADNGPTFADLRALTGPTQRVPPPWWWQAGDSPQRNGIFIPQGSRTGPLVGHYIPAAFATFLVTLGKWQSLIGFPLTEAVPMTVNIHGTPQHVITQAFQRTVLTMDTMDPQYQVRADDVGADMIAIFGPPKATGSVARTVWTVATPTTVLVGPGSQVAVTTFATPFPVTLQGDSLWLSGVLWYHISWKNLSGTRDGWVRADQIDMQATTGQGTQIADLGALSPYLNHLAQAQGNAMAVEVAIPDADRVYSDNANQPIVMASTFKIPLLMTLLKQVEAQGRGLNPTEDSLAQAMIEESDNDAAATLYAEVGFDTGVNAFLQSIGISGITINTDGFGYSTATPDALIALLKALWSGHVLSDTDRQYMLDLMGHIAADQQMGIGTTAPPNATVAMKDGWIQDTDGWVTDSVGIITSGSQTYLVAVELRQQPDENTGWQIVSPLCAAIATAMTAN